MLLHDRGARLVARDRLPPPARPQGKLGGWLRWELIGRDGRVRAGGEQHNLITNAGLDLFASVAIETLTAYCAVGTGATAPDPADETLEAEASRVSRAGPGDSSGIVRVSAGLNQIVRVREFDFNEANGNLTEWGFTNASAGGQLFARELFRDGQGDPATVTKTSDDKLRMTYTLAFTYGPVVATPTAPLVITGIGTINAEYLIIDNNAGGTIAALNFFTQFARGQSDARLSINNSRALEQFPGVPNVGIDDGTATFKPYVPGSYQRGLSEMTWSTSEGLTTWWGLWTRAASPSRLCGPAMQFAEEDRFTKDNLHSLTLTDPLTISWGRDT